MAARWYIVHAYSNFEKKVAESIEEKAKQKGLEHLFEKILVPTEKVVEVRRGRKVDAERKFFPGYVLVKMEMTNEAFHLIKNTPKVTGFLGADQKPIPISDSEAMRILHQVQEGVERPKPSISFGMNPATSVPVVSVRYLPTTPLELASPWGNFDDFELSSSRADSHALAASTTTLAWTCWSVPLVLSMNDTPLARPSLPRVTSRAMALVRSVSLPVLRAGPMRTLVDEKLELVRHPLLH